MEDYHMGDTGPPVDWLLKRDGELIDPSAAIGITVKVRIKGTAAVKFTKTLGSGVSIVTDEEGNKWLRLSFASGDLSVEGTYQAQAVITWSDNTETTPLPYEFRVVEAW